MLICMRCGSPVCVNSPTDAECPACGLHRVIYERNDHVPAAAVSFHDEHETSGVGGAYYATCLLPTD